MRGHVEFDRPKTLILDVNDTKYSVRYTSFSFYPEVYPGKGSTLTRSRLSIYNGENLLLLGRFEEKICLRLTGHLTEFAFFHKFVFTNKMFTYINYDDIFKVSRVLREGEVK